MSKDRTRSTCWAAIAMALSLSACGASPTLTRTPASHNATKQNAPRLTGIAYNGRIVETLDGETFKPMSLEAVGEGLEQPGVAFAWSAMGEYVGWPNRPVFHFMPFQVGVHRVVCRVTDAQGTRIGEKMVIVTVRRAPTPPRNQ